METIKLGLVRKGPSPALDHTSIELIYSVVNGLTLCYVHLILQSKSLTVWLHVEANEQDEDGNQNSCTAIKKTSPEAAAKPDVQEAAADAEEPERSDSDESDYSL